MNTLDEPIKITIMRDIKGIANKAYIVLHPIKRVPLLQKVLINNNQWIQSDRVDDETDLNTVKSIENDIKYQQLFKDWDLWGPLLFCLLLATLLSLQIDVSNQGITFGFIFSFVWIGAVVTSLNASLCRVPFPVFPTVCILGYCIAPLCINALIICLISLPVRSATVTPIWLILIKALLSIFACVWSCSAALSFLEYLTPEDKKELILFPIVLFFVFLTWISMALI